jgi:hypothetical protein
VVLLLQDRQWEGAFTCTLLSSDIAIVFCTILNNMTMKDYFSMLKSSVMPQCPAGLLIKVQPNTYIEKTEHFWTAFGKGNGTAEQRLQYARGMGNSDKLCWHLLCCASLGYTTNHIGRTSLQTGPS